MKRLFLAAMLAAIPSMCVPALFGPNNYNECITDSMKGVTSDVAARAIVRACLSRFPAADKGQKETDLPREVVAKLTGRTSGRDANSFSGTIYNGNKDYSITQITITLTTIPRTKYDLVGTREYNVSDLYVSPLTNSRFLLSIDEDEKNEITWSIVRARGIKQP